MFDGRGGEIYSSQTVTWYAGMGGRQDCLRVIVPSSSSQRYAFVFIFPCILLCVSLCACGKRRRRGGEGDRRMKTDNAEDARVQVCVCVRRGAAAAAGEREMQSVRRRFVLACAPVCVSMCSPRPRSPGREKTENEIKGKQLYWRSP